jgi:hypothetical protein
MAFRRSVVGVVLVMMIAGCTVIGEFGSGRSGAPMNPGPRLDMVIAEPMYGSSSLVPIIRATWTGSAQLASWFVLVDRIADPAATVLLEFDFMGISRDSQRVGTPKYGYSTVYSSRAEIVFTLVDLHSGVIMASASGRGSASGSNYSRLDDQAVQRAVASGLRRLVEIYAGGAS